MKVLFWGHNFLRLRLETGQSFHMVIRATRRSRRSSSFYPVQKESFSLRPSQGFDFKTLSIESGIEPASLQLCGQALYRLRLAEMNNSPRENVFPAGERSALDTREGFDLYSAQASFTWPHVDLSRPTQEVSACFDV